MAQASEAATPAAPPVISSAPPPPVTPAPSAIKLPALTIVDLKLLDEVSSKSAISGQPVRLALARPLYITDTLGVPAGTAVEGLVIHAAKGGMGGKSGELLLAAKRIILSPSVEIPLRSFKLGPARGKSNETLAVVTTATVGVVGLLITGGSAKAPAGSVASAKTAAEVTIPVALLTALPPQAPIVAAPVVAPPIATQSTTAEGKLK